MVCVVAGGRANVARVRRPVVKPCGTTGYRIVSLASGDPAERLRNSRADGRELFRPGRLGADPRQTLLPAFRWSRLGPSYDSGPVLDTGNSGDDAPPCRPRWSATCLPRAKPASAVPLGDKLDCNIAFGVAPAGTTAHTLSASNDETAARRRRDLVQAARPGHAETGPRELLSPTVKSRRRTSNSSPRRFFLLPATSRQNPPSTQTNSANVRPPHQPTAIDAWRTGPIGTAKVALPLIREVAAWEAARNAAQFRVDWQFTTADARIKLHRL